MCERYCKKEKEKGKKRWQIFFFFSSTQIFSSRHSQEDRVQKLKIIFPSNFVPENIPRNKTINDVPMRRGNVG